MKLKVVGAYDEVFEKTYKDFKAEERLVMAFEYMSLYRNVLIERLTNEKDDFKIALYNKRIVDIMEILEYYNDLTMFLHESATAL